MTKKDMEKKIENLEENIKKLVDAINTLYEKLEISDYTEDMKFEYDIQSNLFIKRKILK